MGHRPPVFPDHYDEDGPHQTCRIHGVSKEVGSSLALSLSFSPSLFSVLHLPWDAIRARTEVWVTVPDSQRITFPLFPFPVTDVWVHCSTKTLAGCMFKWASGDCALQVFYTKSMCYHLELLKHQFIDHCHTMFDINVLFLFTQLSLIHANTLAETLHIDFTCPTFSASDLPSFNFKHSFCV